MQLFLAYFGLAMPGRNVSAWVAAGMALTLYTRAIERTKAGTMITNATFRPFTVCACVRRGVRLLRTPVAGTLAWQNRHAGHYQHIHRHRAHRHGRGVAQILRVE